MILIVNHHYTTLCTHVQAFLWFRRGGLESWNGKANHYFNGRAGTCFHWNCWHSDSLFQIMSANVVSVFLPLWRWPCKKIVTTATVLYRLTLYSCLYSDYDIAILNPLMLAILSPQFQNVVTIINTYVANSNKTFPIKCLFRSPLHQQYLALHTTMQYLCSDFVLVRRERSCLNYITTESKASPGIKG